MHKIIHGRSEDVLPNLAWHVGGDLPLVNCIITDPPYGANFRSRRATTPTGLKYARDIANDADVAGAIVMFLDVMDACLPYLSDECDLYVFTRWDIYDDWLKAAKTIEGFEYKMMLVWEKGIPGMGDIDGNWGCGHELIMYFKKGRRDMPYRRSSVLSFDKPHPSQIIHPTEKPVALLEELVKISTEPGGLVLDPFSGSGSTIVAAQRLGRSAIGIEMDAIHHRDSVQRLNQPAMVF